MQKKIHPSVINGSIPAPASKSMMQRAIAVAILANGTSILRNYTTCNDSDAALRIAHDLGCEVTTNGTDVTIISSSGGQANHEAGYRFIFNTTNSLINCGESGLGIRMFTPVAALNNRDMILTGEGSLKKRPISMLEEPLRQLGARIETNNGFVPIIVKGPLKGGNTIVDGSISSQMLTGLLIALPCASEDSVLTVTNLTSKPYIEMTLQVMKSFGVEASHDNFKTFSVKGRQRYQSADYNVEGDWSGAAFLLVAGALAGSVTVRNLNIGSMQADVAILKALKAAGAKITSSENSVTVKKSALKAFEFDATDCPDLFPPLVALASHCKGASTIRGVNRLKHKESDRAKVLKKEFARAGTEILLKDDLMIIRGGTFKGGRMHSNNDHRIAMAGAVAGIAAPGPVEIENPESVAKSYPGFYEDLAALGANIESIS